MKFTFVFLVFILSSCSQLKTSPECEGENWSTYSVNLALNGVELNDDAKFQRCMKQDKITSPEIIKKKHAQAKKKYCTFNVVLSRGENGQPFNFNFCQFPKEDEVRVLHAKGVNRFCKNKLKAYELGFSGKPYIGLCRKDLEPSFLFHFDRGRRERVVEKIKKIQARQKQIDIEIESLRLEQSKISRDLLKVPGATKNRSKKSGLSGLLAGTDYDPSLERQHLTQKLENRQQQVLALQNEKNNLQEALGSYQDELLKIPQQAPL